MSQGLSYRTAGGISPRGLSEVYLCCHPDDLESCLEPVARDILEIKPDSAVWYRTPESPADGPEEDLERMELFVIPVTRRFLETGNDARCRELPFALEQHIPVLPLLWEERLEQLFDEVCGELHTLAPHAGSAAGYRRKLRQTLDGTLLDADLRYHIRNSFDTHIFLSYRKKDRALAERIPVLIHEDTLLENSAVWFDDHLFPGENFDKALADMIRHSSVFLLLATPALSETPNYVTEHELPLAKSLGLPVLAVTAGGADAYPPEADAVCSLNEPQKLRDQLKELLHKAAVSHAAAADGYPLLSERLTGLMGGDIGESLPDLILAPQQHYYLGLAYLNGIDVETDRARALKFLQISAKCGYPDAARLLSVFYANGIGTARDTVRAAHWQEHYLDLLDDGNETGGETDENTLLARYSEYNSLFLYRAAAGQTEQLAEAQEKLCLLTQRLELTGALPPAAGVEELCREGILAALDREWDTAEARYRDALELLGECRDRLMPAEYDIITAQIGYLRSDSAYDCGSYDNAILRLQEALAAVQDTPGETAAFWRFLCGTQLGGLLMQKIRLPEAEPVLRTALEAAERLESSPALAPSARDLYLLHGRLGLLAAGKDPEEARDHLLAAQRYDWELIRGGKPDSELLFESCRFLFQMGNLSTFSYEERETFLRECRTRADSLSRNDRIMLRNMASVSLKKLKIAGTGSKIKKGLKSIFGSRE